MIAKMKRYEVPSVSMRQLLSRQQGDNEAVSEFADAIEGVCSNGAHTKRRH
jgi:hypothetical protein